MSMKKPVLFSALLLALAGGAVAKTRQAFSLRYLVYDKQAKEYAVYENDERASGLSALSGREILGIRFDRQDTDSILLAEKDGNRYRAARLNIKTGEEQELFTLERDIYMFQAFTEDALFYCEKGEHNNEPHALYEYDSRTGGTRLLFEVSDTFNDKSQRYVSSGITSVCANENAVYFYQYDGSGYGIYAIDRASGEVRRLAVDIGWAAFHLNGNKTVREGVSVTRSEKMTVTRHSGSGCVITDMDTFAETACTFKKRYERQAGPLLLLSENYVLVPLAVRKFRDSIQNGLFGHDWTVQYTVFDARQNKAVFGGLVTRTNELMLVDAVLQGGGAHAEQAH